MSVAVDVGTGDDLPGRVGDAGETRLPQERRPVQIPDEVGATHGVAPDQVECPSSLMSALATSCHAGSVTDGGRPGRRASCRSETRPRWRR